MALRKIHIEKIANLIAGKLVEEHAILTSKEAVLGRIQSIFSENTEMEHQIEAEAQKLLDKNRTSFGDIDENKAFALIKKQLAKQKNFIL